MTTFHQIQQTFCSLYDTREAAEAVCSTIGADTVAGEYAAAAARALNIADAVLARRDITGALKATQVAAALLTDALTACKDGPGRAELETTWLAALEAHEHVTALAE